MTVPGPSPAPDASSESEPLSDAEVSASALKSSEKLLDYLKHDTERAGADIRVAEDRARGNAAIAGAAIPLLTFLRSLESTLSGVQTFLAVACLVLIAFVLLLTLGVMWPRKTNRTQDSWYAERQGDTYHERPLAAYDKFLHELQGMWLGYLADARRVRDSKYAWLHPQTVCVLMLLLLFLALLASTIG